MTRILSAILLTSPLALLAQQTPHTQAFLTQPAIRSSSPATSQRRTSTGVVPPKLIHFVKIAVQNPHPRVTGHKIIVIVDMTVNDVGVPDDLKIEEPTDQTLDEEVLDAVSQFRYIPGTLSGEPTAAPVRLHYTLNPGVIY